MCQGSAGRLMARFCLNFLPSLNRPFRRDYPGRGGARGVSSGNVVRRALGSHHKRAALEFFPICLNWGFPKRAVF